MGESNGESRSDILKLNQPVSIDAEVQTENGMHREGKSYRGRGRGHWRCSGRGGRGFKRRARGESGPWNKRRRFGHTGTVDDFPFLHGGNSKDPLNLKSVKPVDEAENMKPIDIIIPKNIHDPLNLRNVNKNRARRKRRSSKLAEKEEIEGNSESSAKRRGSIASSINEKRQEDPIVSPVPLSVVRKFCGNPSRRLPHQKIEKRGRKMQNSTEKPQPSSGVVAGASNSQAIENLSKTEDEKNLADKEKKSGEKKKDNQRFRYGNYTRYYGNRIEKGSGHDPRMKVLKKEWFEKKSVLDIGCNVGYLTLSIAKEYQPRNIVGIDIDAHLVGVARKNIRHYCDKDVPIVGGFPASFAQRYGPVSAPSTTFSIKFPDNIWFRCENYVLEKDELLDAVKEEYDVIMALSITKWIHLNWGDVGIKRFFKRVYRHLRPGGLFILEPQNFETYKKRAKLTKDINEIYKTIEFMPNAFQEYLIVDIGFDFCQHIDPPKAHTKGFERPIQVYYKRVSHSFTKTSYYDHDGIPETCVADSFSLNDGISEGVVKTSMMTESHPEMEWPKFDFPKCSHSQRHRLSNAGKSNCGLKKNRSKVCRSLTVDFENIKSRKKENSAEGNTMQNESVITLHQPVSPNSNPLICAQGNSFRMNRKENAEKVPPLSPVLVNGFLKESIAHSPIALENSDLNATEILTSRCVDSINPVLYCKDPIILESPELIFTPPHSKQLLLSGESLTFSLQRSKVIPRSQDFSQSGNSTFFVTAAKESDNLNSKYKKSGKKAGHRRKLHASSSTATPTSTHSLNNSLASLETLPPSQIEYKSLNRIETSPNLDFMNSQLLNFESDKSITMQHSDSDVSQNHAVCVDDSESVAATDEQSRDCFFDITINEIESNDLTFETKLFVQSISSPAGNQSKIYNFHDEIDEVSHQKQYHRLSKLAEILKKRLFISSSDLVMWKCEKPKQHQARRVAVISSAEQWGFCWTLVKNVKDSRTAHIVDSEPMKKAMDVVSKNTSQKEKNTGDDEEGQDCHDSLQQISEETFILYQPLSKLNTALGEFILSPRYYR